MEDIKAPQAAVDKAVQAALEAEHNRAASPKKSKGKSKFIQFVSAVAACAVAACGITAISMTTGNYTSNSPGETSADSKNYFSLVVNAAEINKSNVQIGKIVCDQSMWSYLTDNTSSDDEDKQRITDFTISPIIDLSVNCTGNNIKYVTYSVEGAAIQLENITPVEEGTVSAGELNDYNRYHRVIEKSFKKPYDEIVKEVDHGPDSIETPAFIYDAQGKPCYKTWSMGAFVDKAVGKLKRVDDATIQSMTLDPKLDMNYKISRRHHRLPVNRE